MVMRIEDVPEGLAPFHFAGMVSNPSVDSLSVQPQKILIIAPSANEVQGTNEILDVENVNDIYGEDSTIAKMIHVTYKANKFTPIFALAVQESLEKTFEDHLNGLPEVQFTQIATSFNDTVTIKALDKELESRWGSARQIDGHVFVGASGSISDLEAKYS